MAFVSLPGFRKHEVNNFPLKRCPSSRVKVVPSACAPSPQPARAELWRSVESLRASLARAVDAERFSDAARLRDEIETLTSADEYVRVHRMLEEAVAEQRFLDAAKLRDDLALLTPPPSLAAASASPPFARAGPEPSPSTEWNLGSGGGGDANLGLNRDAAASPTSSVCVTDDVRVQVESFHMPEHNSTTSGESMMRYTFGYRVRITNTSKSTVQLIARHWVIENATGPESEVRGTGVVGRQPVLEPGESFDYTSACPITCKMQSGLRVVGNMRGEYTLVRGETGMDQFSARIGRIYFVLPEN